MKRVARNNGSNIRVALLCLVVFTIPYQEVYVFNNPYLFLPILSFILYFLVSIFTTKNILSMAGSRYFLTPLIILWVLLIMLTFINYETKYMPKAYSYLQRLLTQMIFFVMVFNEVKKYGTKVRGIFLSFICSIILMAFFYYAGIGVTYYSDRLFIFGTNPNSLGVWCVISILFAFHLLTEHRTSLFEKIFLLISMLTAAVLIASSGSRGAIVTLTVGLFVYAMLLVRSFTAAIKFAGPFIVFFVVLLNIVLSSKVVQERLETESERQDFGGRLPVWEATFDIIGENPVFGVGPPRYEPEIIRRIGIYKVPHNEYLLILCYSGIVGFILFLLFLFKFFYAALRTLSMPSASRALPISLLVTLCIFMASGGRLFTTFVAFFVFAIIGAYTHASVKRPRQRKRYITKIRYEQPPLRY